MREDTLRTRHLDNLDEVAEGHASNTIYTMKDGLKGGINRNHFESGP